MKKCASVYRVLLPPRRVACGSTLHIMTRRKGSVPVEQTAPESEGRMLDRGVMKPYKLCAQCHKPMVQRAKWKDNWADVKLCSERCRRAAKSERKAAPVIEATPDS